MPTLTVPPPSFVIWELTLRCNALYLHSDNGSAADAVTANELSPLEALAVVDDLAEAGVPLLGLTGGEPLLRPDWQQIADRAIRRGIAVSLSTNGLLLTPANADALAGLPAQSVTVSLDSHSAQVHDRLHQCPGLHAAAEAAIRRLVARGLRTVVSFTPTRLNWGDAAAVVERAEVLGAAAVAFSEYVPAGRSLSPLFAPTASQLRAAAATWERLREEQHGRIALLGPELWPTLGEKGNGEAGCAAARQMARLRPDGTLTPCPFLPVVLGSLRETSFAALWAQAVSAASPECATPEVLPLCRACRWLSGGARAREAPTAGAA